jgi:hypothetical protein
MICQCASDSGVRTLRIGLVFLVFALHGGPSAIVTNSLGTLFPEFYLHDDENFLKAWSHLKHEKFWPGFLHTSDLYGWVN